MFDSHQTPIIHRRPGTGEVVSFEIRVDQINPSDVPTVFIAEGYEFLAVPMVGQHDVFEAVAGAEAEDATVTPLIPHQAAVPLVEAVSTSAKAWGSPLAVATRLASYSSSRAHTGHIHAAWVLPDGTLSSLHSARRFTSLPRARKSPDGLVDRVTCSYCRKTLVKARLLPEPTGELDSGTADSAAAP